MPEYRCRYETFDGLGVDQLPGELGTGHKKRAIEVLRVSPVEV